MTKNIKVKEAAPGKVKIANAIETKDEKIIRTLYEALERKDRLIERLKEENRILLKTALKRSEKIS